MDEWDGVCKCGKAAMDGIRCHLGATHQANASSAQSTAFPGASFPWTNNSEPSLSSGTTETFPWFTLKTPS